MVFKDIHKIDSQKYSYVSKVFSYKNKVYCAVENNYFFEIYMLDKGKFVLLKKFRHTFLEKYPLFKIVSICDCFIDKFMEIKSKEEKIRNSLFNKYKLFYKNECLYFINLETLKIKKINVSELPLIAYNNEYFLIKNQLKIFLFNKNVEKIYEYSLKENFEKTLIKILLIDKLIYFVTKNGIYIFDFNFKLIKSQKFNNISNAFNTTQYLIIFLNKKVYFFTKDMKEVNVLNIPDITFKAHDYKLSDINDVFEFQDYIFFKTEKNIYQTKNFTIEKIIKCDDIIYINGKLKKVFYEEEKIRIGNKTFKVQKLNRNYLFLMENIYNKIRQIIYKLLGNIF